jgi:hypothetical protein
VGATAEAAEATVWLLSEVASLDADEGATGDMLTGGVTLALIELMSAITASMRGAKHTRRFQKNKLFPMTVTIPK